MKPTTVKPDHEPSLRHLATRRPERGSPTIRRRPPLTRVGPAPVPAGGFFMGVHRSIGVEFLGIRSRAAPTVETSGSTILGEALPEFPQGLPSVEPTDYSSYSPKLASTPRVRPGKGPSRGSLKLPAFRIDRPLGRDRQLPELARRRSTGLVADPFAF